MRGFHLKVPMAMENSQKTVLCRFSRFGEFQQKVTVSAITQHARK